MVFHGWVYIGVGFLVWAHGLLVFFLSFPADSWFWFGPPPVSCSRGWLWKSILLGGVGFSVLVWFLVLFSLVGPDATAGCGILVLVWAPSGSGVGCKFWFWLVLA